MADEPDSLVLRYHRRISERTGTLAEDMREVKQRLGGLWEGLAPQSHSIAPVSRRLDRLDERVDRIEKRLDLVAA